MICTIYRDLFSDVRVLETSFHRASLLQQNDQCWLAQSYNIMSLERISACASLATLVQWEYIMHAPVSALKRIPFA